MIRAEGAPRIDRRRDALIVVDMQYDFMPGGALGVLEGDKLVAPIAQLMNKFDCVVATQDWHPRGHVSFASTHGAPVYSSRNGQVMWPDHCIQGSAGAALHTCLPKEPISLILRKGINLKTDSYSAFSEDYGPDGTRAQTGLHGYFRSRGIFKVYVCGLARDYCCLWTAEDAARYEMETCFLWDLTKPVDSKLDAEVERRLAAAGVTIIQESI